MKVLGCEGWKEALMVCVYNMEREYCGKDRVNCRSQLNL